MTDPRPSPRPAQVDMPPNMSYLMSIGTVKDKAYVLEEALSKLGQPFTLGQIFHTIYKGQSPYLPGKTTPTARMNLLAKLTATLRAEGKIVMVKASGKGNEYLHRDRLPEGTVAVAPKLRKSRRTEAELRDEKNARRRAAGFETASIPEKTVPLPRPKPDPVTGREPAKDRILRLAREYMRELGLVCLEIRLDGAKAHREVVQIVKEDL